MPEFKFLIARKDTETYQNNLEASIKRLGVTQVFQIMDQNDKNENIFKKYNAGIQALYQYNLKDDDIIIFVHEDVGIIDPFFMQKVESIFNQKKDIGLLGIAGAVEFTEAGGWWMNRPENLRGHLIQGKEGGGPGDGFHLVKGPVGYFDDLVCIDGCIMMTTGKIIKECIIFDDITFPDGNDMYDIDYCFNVLEHGYKIATADILVYHKSSGLGVMTDSWKINKDKLIAKWTAKGYTLPIVKHDFKLKPAPINEIIEIEI